MRPKSLMFPPSLPPFRFQPTSAPRSNRGPNLRPPPPRAPANRHPAPALAPPRCAENEWGQTIEQVEGLLAGLDLCVFARRGARVGDDIVVDHDDGDDEACAYGQWSRGWELVGHDAVVGAAEGVDEPVVEKSLFILASRD